jgi:hypothetical protein
MQVGNQESYLVIGQPVIAQMLNPVIIQSDEFPTADMERRLIPKQRD